jgi:hypothetical protein
VVVLLLYLSLLMMAVAAVAQWAKEAERLVSLPLLTYMADFPAFPLVEREEATRGVQSLLLPPLLEASVSVVAEQA